MRVLRNFVYLLIAIFLIYINAAFIAGKQQDTIFYLTFLDIGFAILIVLGVVYHFYTESRISDLSMNMEKLRLNVSDYAVEASIFRAIVELMEIFGENLSLEEILEKIVNSVKNFFKNDIVYLQLFEHHFFRAVKGGELDITDESLEGAKLKAYPTLINSISSFPIYAFLTERGITSFIVVPLKEKENRTIGILGVFSREGKTYSQRDLSLLNMISVPVSLIIENAELMEKTRILSITDGLTQLYNRRHFQETLQMAISEARKNGHVLSLAICDIDNFKFYNDRNGHLAGDRVLKDVSHLLKQNTKGSDIVGRYGGEEFIILFPQTSKENAERICENIRRNVEAAKFPFEEFQPNRDLTISFGVSSFPSDAEDPEDLIRKADNALYEAKKRGRNRVVVFSDT